MKDKCNGLAETDLSKIQYHKLAADALSLLGLAVILGYAFIGVSGLPDFIKWKRVRYEDKSTEK